MLGAHNRGLWCCFCGETVGRHLIVIELCGFGMGADLASLPQVMQMSPPTKDSLVRVSGCTAAELRGGMQLAPLLSHGPAPPPTEGCLALFSQYCWPCPAVLNSTWGGAQPGAGTS